METLIVILIVLVAGAYVARRSYRAIAGRCGCGCGSVKKARLTVGGKKAR